MNNLFVNIKNLFMTKGKQGEGITRAQTLLLILAGPLLILFGFFLSILGREYLLFGTNFSEYITGAPAVLASGLIGPVPDKNPDKTIENQLISKGILLSDNPNALTAIRQNLQNDPVTIASANEILAVIDGNRLKNVVTLENIIAKYNLYFKAKPTPADYKNSDRTQEAIIAAWDDHYPLALRIDQILIPNNLSDMDDASVYGVELLTQPINLNSDQVEIQINFSPNLLEEKNMLKMTIDTHGYILPTGENAILGFEQPYNGNWADLMLSKYVEKSSQPQTVYVPLSDFMKSAGGLTPNQPSGIMQVQIHGQGNYHIDISSIIAFYVSQN